MKRIALLLIVILIVSSGAAQIHFNETTHYVLPDFTEGLVLNKDGTTLTARLNYNALTEEMVFEDRERKLPLAEHEILLIDTIFIKDKKFVVRDGHFYEYSYHSSVELYIDYKCRVKDPTKPSAYGGTSEVSNKTYLNTFIANGTIYEINLPGNFRAEPYFYYWLKKDGQFSRFINLRQLRKLYKGQEGPFKDYEEKHDVKYKDKEAVIALIEYMEKIF